jgi:hypothetical protein
MNNIVLEDSFYDKWRRQKNYETEINTFNNKLKKMQEKLEGLQQKQLQEDLCRGGQAYWTDAKTKGIEHSY